MFSGTLLKGGYANLQNTETRVIDTNELVAKRLEEEAEKANRAANEEFSSLYVDGEGFQEGLAAESIEGASGETGEEGEASSGNVIKVSESREIIAKAKEEADRILEQTWSRAKAECDKLRSDTQMALVAEREEMLAQAREDGYREGREMAERELEAERGKLKEQLRQKEAEYQGLLDEMEPQFVDAITGIYEHIFHVELESYRDILVHLISATMRKTEGAREFMVHVSKEDYPYVSMQKKEIMAASAMPPNSILEIIEDITLTKNAAIIETEGGIFDCGLGTQLGELGQKLRLLSYER